MFTPKALKAILMDSSWAVVAASSDHPFALAQLCDEADGLMFPPGFVASIIDGSGDATPAVFFRDAPIERVKALAGKAHSKMYVTSKEFFVRGKTNEPDFTTLKVDSPMEFHKNFVVVTPGRLGTPPENRDMSQLVAFTLKAKKEKST
jgi:hypothetical protein